MNILRECTFIDRRKNSLVEIDDLVEEARSTGPADTGPRGHQKLHLLLYFTAGWLPPNCSEKLDQHLSELMMFAPICKEPVQIVFVSSDNSKQSYFDFLRKNKHIRYALDYHEHELKNQLCKYFNVDAIPFLSLLTLKFDRNQAVVEFKSSNTDIKSRIQSMRGPFGVRKIEKLFGMKSSIKTRASLADASSIVGQSSATSVSQSTSSTVACVAGPVNLISYLTSHLVSIGVEPEPVGDIATQYNFVFIFFANECLPSEILFSLAEFWRNFHEKHKILFILAGQLTSGAVPADLNWFRFREGSIETKTASLLCVNQVPKLVVVEAQSGQVINSELEHAIIEYGHELSEACLESSTRVRSCVSQRKVRPGKCKKSRLSPVLLRGLSNSLVDVNSRAKSIAWSQHDACVDYFYLFYFCSSVTANDESLYEQAVSYMRLMQLQRGIDYKLVIISSDSNPDDFDSLLDKCAMKPDLLVPDGENNSLNVLPIHKLALQFDARELKQQLSAYLRVSTIPSFSLVNAQDGTVVHRNLVEHLFKRTILPTVF